MKRAKSAMNINNFFQAKDLTGLACILRTALFVLVACLAIEIRTAQAVDIDDDVPASHAIAMHGLPALPDGFSRLPFTDDYATIGGKLVIGEVGTFDNLNPFIVGGTQPSVHLEQTYFVVQRHTIESLMARSPDEPFTLYGLIAEKVRLPKDRSWIEFHLNPKARFSNGTAITVDDVIFSIETLAAKGRPNMRRYYQAVAKAEQTGPNSIKLEFNDEANQETPLIIGLMPILSKTFYEENAFEETTITPPLGSGPYTVSKVDQGRSITFERNQDYWGKNLAINKDRHNFQTIQYKYYRDPALLFEAFKAGDVQFRIERSASRWATGYNFPAVRNRLVIKEEIRHGRPADMYAFVFNTRRDIFADPTVRLALVQLFNFDWMNKNLYHGAYKRVQSFFDNSELSSYGRMVSSEEQKLLNKVGAQLDPDIQQRGWRAPTTISEMDMRINQRTALSLFEQAGWTLQDGVLTHVTTGKPFSFEILLMDRQEEKIAQTFANDLKAVGIEVNVRLVDSSNYHQRRQVYDFDMTPFRWRGTLSPGNEQAFRFGSNEADIEGTYNLAGVQSKAIDKTITYLTNAETRAELITAARALDRQLLSGYYAIPLFYQPTDRIAYWVELQRPEFAPLTGIQLDSWWRIADN